MKQRIKELIKELKETEQELQKEIPNFFISNDTIFHEALTCYRGELAYKSKQPNKTKLATEKQIAYVQKLADQKGINITITGNETSEKISKLIRELQQ